MDKDLVVTIHGYYCWNSDSRTKNNEEIGIGMRSVPQARQVLSVVSTKQENTITVTFDTPLFFSTRKGRTQRNISLCRPITIQHQHKGHSQNWRLPIVLHWKFLCFLNVSYKCGTRATPEFCSSNYWSVNVKLIWSVVQDEFKSWFLIIAMTEWSNEVLIRVFQWTVSDI